jgi:hypothetical protein
MTDHGFISLGKFSSARDSMLHFLSGVEWCNASGGSVEAPTGWFAKISFLPAEIHIPNTEITSVLEDWFEANPEVIDSPELRKELEGYFIVRENEQGFVTVTEVSSSYVLDAEYQKLETAFDVWDSQE